ncbi:hypothetical protein Tco_0629965 [Tanacetum coccineum]|uniref:Reverse transcriptase domain-containing protein n=1 Tax=Tanacetum coccineum TaxID=301880 RepID=A0ABQ4WUY5_9ASTR
MRPRRLLRLLNDFDGKIRYHIGKASVAADALSRNERAKPLRPWILSQDYQRQQAVMTRFRQSPWEGVIRCSAKGKVEPSVILELSKILNCSRDEPLAIPLDEIQIDDKLNFIEEPVEIMDREVKWLKQSHIPIVKVHWNSRRGPEFTWEREDQMKKKYPHLFINPSSTS